MLLTAFLVLLAINAGLGLASIRQRDVGAREARRYGTAGERTSELLADLVDQETGVRGFVITGADEFLRPYNRGRAAVEEHTARLRELLAGDPELTEQVERIERLTAQWQERAAEPEIEATRRGDRAAAEQLVASGQGQVRFNRALTEVASLRTSLDAAQDRADALAAGAGQRVNNVLFATFFVGAALLVATARLTDRWISAPLQRISGAVRQVSDGHLEHRIPSPGPVDVARLGTDAEAMRRRIVAELDAARRAEQALRTRGPVIAALREQLQPQHRTLSDGLVTAAAFEPAAGVLAGD
ncbi:MAG: CHASE3 domain-containing protein, partial [Egibacteraceae bacterium]